MSEINRGTSKESNQIYLYVKFMGLEYHISFLKNTFVLLILNIELQKRSSSEFWLEI